MTSPEKSIALANKGIRTGEEAMRQPLSADSGECQHIISKPADWSFQTPTLVPYGGFCKSQPCWELEKVFPRQVGNNADGVWQRASTRSSRLDEHLRATPERCFPTELPNYYQACEANDHFECVHWTEQDLVSRLKELKVQATPEMIDDMRSSYAARHIADRMVEQGWDAIEQAIAEV